MIISEQAYKELKEHHVQGRYVVNDQIIDFLNGMAIRFKVETIGRSVQKRPIQSITLGSGTKRILMWSQMHGNESTTTKAVLDMLNFLDFNTHEASSILKNCTIQIIPILNPDGAHAYTRYNANQVDLNRDAQNRSQPESKILRKQFDDFHPDFCFNLHDQRTLYNVGKSQKPATVSFLAPAHNAERTISKSRKVSMQLIAAMNKRLQQMIPGQVGRYNDAFNANCVGDAFQMLDTPTVLFEAGHFKRDYEREKTREFIFYALIEALFTITEGTILKQGYEAYFDIPENGKQFFDVLIKNVSNAKSVEENDVGVLFEEELNDGEIRFKPRVQHKGNLEEFFGHETYDFQNLEDVEFLRKSNLSSIFDI